jgi:uncharacterized membrane protein YbhN (UPF0104 family)
MAIAGLAAVGGAAFGAQALGSTLSRALDDVGQANRQWLWVAACCFCLAVFCLGGAWRASLRLCGGQLSLADSFARYGTGCLVSSLLPGGLGGATRVALYSRTLDGEDRVWRVGGSAVLVSVARTSWVGVLFAYAAASGAVPRWPVAIAAVAAAVTIGVCFWARGHALRGHVAHLLDAFSTLGSAPRHALRLSGWAFSCMALRVCAATAVVAAFGVGSPLEAALIIVPALAVASMAPITPANVGLASGAVMVALHSKGVDGSTALAAGIALNGVETAVGLAIGVYGLTYLAWQDARKRAVLALAGSGAAAVVCAVGATLWL